MQLVIIHFLQLLWCGGVPALRCPALPCPTQPGPNPAQPGPDLISILPNLVFTWCPTWS